MVLPRHMNTPAIKTIAFFLFFISGTSVALAGSSKGEKFDPGGTILHHVKDAHEIHVMDGVSISLPIIIYDDGLKIFSSSHFYHSEPKEVMIGDAKEHYYAYNGYALFHEKIYKLDHGALHIEDGHPHNEKVADFSITKNVSGMLFGVFMMFMLFIAAAKHYKKHGIAAPKKGIVRAVEPLVLFISEEVARPSIGHKYQRYVPFLLTLFFFIWFGNLLGLIPFLGGMNFTGNIAVTMVLASFTFIITSFSGNKHYWGHIFAPPGVPVALYPLLIPIEIIGVLSKPIVLMLRLFANITAGHIIILAFTSLIFIFGEMSTGAGYGVSVVSMAFSIFMNFLELLVGFLQAYVFVLLSALYFGAAVEEVHH